MKENKEENHSQAGRDVASTDDTANQPETSNRRELIARYGKVAIVAAPLLMFVSKARAIHSRP
jgi:hypothetical protein